MAHDIQLDSNQRKLIRPLFLLINKPILYVANVNENEIIKKKQNPEIQKLFNFAQERGFIKAEVYTFNELMQYKSEQALKNAGKTRYEGKNYIVQNEDILFIKFNV